MAKNSLLVSSNFASVVDRVPRYFVLSSSGLRIGSWLWNNFFYPSMENASNTGFWVGGKHLATLLVSVLSVECMLAIFKKKLLPCSGRELATWVYSTKVKIIVARYPLHYRDINNWCWILSRVSKLVCIRQCRHFVFSPRGKYIDRCSVLHSGLVCTSNDEKCTL